MTIFEAIRADNCSAAPLELNVFISNTSFGDLLKVAARSLLASLQNKLYLQVFEIKLKSDSICGFTDYNDREKKT